ncbi:methylated-DNA--[protein]-cysteine S-methyltransferase [Actinoallomurus purpureus]|uniref:methylated-DNA--[protein]-cysteine S-methyltransferase n=1 Tax=Actinoallomurus purpureus TaxID=478114 RepID=UPI0020927536|nr:methylated-DNA--[protein]-cysteine S-methyltransferase [Actinoallomurus purpureus]MCO6006119.1 methylated-DNA--[protein]-cysteine S-methyltransferase [Actinoallomurus purpureus]
MSRTRPRGVRFLPPAPDAVPCRTVLDSPLGELVLTGDGRALRRLDLWADTGPVPLAGRSGDVVLAAAVDQLCAYFAGELTAFDLPIAPSGTDFQQRVWRRLAAIPYGETLTYGRIAADIGRPGAARAVGAAGGRTPVPIILPCHRVIAASGALVRYGLGGVGAKRHLLDLESGLVNAVPRAGRGR